MSVMVDALLGLSVAVPLSAAGYAIGRRRASRSAAQSAVSAASTSRVASDAASLAGETARPPVSDDTVRVLRVLRTGWILVDRSDRVIDHSDGIGVLGLVRDVDLRHDAVRDLVRRARWENRTIDTDLDLPRGPINAGRVDLHVRLAPLTDELVVVLVEDQTQARRIEETRRDFVVNVSHELKTPVGGLRLLAEAVEDAADDSEAVARFASRMKTETVRLAHLVQEIVDLSRLQGADTLASARPVDLAECTTAAVEETRLLAENKNIDILVSCDSPPHTVLGDSSLLTTAVRNLVNNAVNYSEPATRIVVGVTREDDGIVVQVTDQGIGLSAEDVERIFERFYRVDPARSRQTGGTGLGLAIVKHVCANHGGQIRVWSEPGVGSTFEMQIPAWSGEPTDVRSGPGTSARPTTH